MKFLFDQSADFRLISYLEELGHDVHVVSRDYPHGLDDDVILGIARTQRRILVVADYDFGELIFHKGLAHAGVILFRLPGAPLSVKIDRLAAVLAGHAEDLRNGEFLVVTRSKIRVAGRPQS